MAILKHDRAGAPMPFSYDVAAILLAGWGAEPPCGVVRTHGFGDGMFKLFGGDVVITSLWRQHEPYLRDVAAQWGWQPLQDAPDGGRRFWAEHLAAGGA